MSKRFMAAGFVVAAALFVTVTYGAVVSADHPWGNYHWARTSPVVPFSFDLTVINSTTPDWDWYVSKALTDWSNAPAGVDQVINMVHDENGSTRKKVRRQCRAPSGAVRICNLAYGTTGWLGIAGVSLDSNGHILKGYTKLNDTYFSSGFYDTYLWRQGVTCQELGHNIGLDHPDEDFDVATSMSCMEYQNPPFDTPYLHDYEQLELIYGHADSYDTYAGASEEGGGSGGGCNAPPGKGCNKSGRPQSNADIGWGMSMGRRGNHEGFIRIDPDGTRHITHVRWVEDHDDGHNAH